MSPKFEMVRVADLIISNTKGTQRAEGVSERRAEQIATAWDMTSVGTLSVSRRKDGSLFVMDGGHRTCAARIVGIEHLPAMVYEGLNRAEEARIFNGVNTFQQPSAISRFLARVAAGDVDACIIHSIIEGHGWKVSFDSTDGHLACIAAVERIYGTGAGVLPKGQYKDVLDWTLDVATAAWGHDNDAVSQFILLGLAQLIGRFGADVDTKKLVSEMSQTRPKVLIGHAKSMRDALGGTIPAHMAKVLVGLHNKKRRTNLLPEWIWTR